MAKKEKQPPALPPGISVGHAHPVWVTRIENVSSHEKTTLGRGDRVPTIDASPHWATELLPYAKDAAIGISLAFVVFFSAVLVWRTGYRAITWARKEWRFRDTY